MKEISKKLANYAIKRGSSDNVSIIIAYYTKNDNEYDDDIDYKEKIRRYLSTQLPYRGQRRQAGKHLVPPW